MSENLLFIFSKPNDAKEYLNYSILKQKNDSVSNDNTNKKFKRNSKFFE